jgi:hypothetical protein
VAVPGDGRAIVAGGAFTEPLDPLPSLPHVSEPQQVTVWPASRAQVNRLPTASPVAASEHGGAAAQRATPMSRAIR